MINMDKLAQASKGYERASSPDSGSFMTAITTAIRVADFSNTVLLHRAYPELVEGYIYYNKGTNWERFVGVFESKNMAIEVLDSDRISVFNE